LPRAYDSSIEEFEFVIVKNVVVLKDSCHHRLGLVNGLCVECGMKPLYDCFFRIMNRRLNSEMVVVLRELAEAQKSVVECKNLKTPKA
jgi:hypothetical protein